MINLMQVTQHILSIIGDSGYGLQPWLLTPILDVPDHTLEGKYTKFQKAEVAVLEWRLGVKYSPVMAACIVNTCVVMHNLLIINNMDNEPPPDLNHNNHKFHVCFQIKLTIFVKELIL